MLFSYSLLVFALTSSVTAHTDGDGQALLHNKDPRLTHKGEVWYRLMRKTDVPKWPLYAKFDDVIQFDTAPIDSLPAGSHGVSTEGHHDGDIAEEAPHWVSAVSFLRLRRVLEDSDAYHLDYKDHVYYRSINHGSLSDKPEKLRLRGVWGRSKQLSVQTRNDDGRVVTPTHLEEIIAIDWVSEKWQVRFLEIHGHDYTTAPTSYLLSDDVVKSMIAKTGRKRKHSELSRRQREPWVALGAGMYF